MINLANWITLLRILCSLTLLFCMPLSLPFYVLYTAAGLSDILDGFIARKTNTVTKFGAKLDTFAEDFQQIAMNAAMSALSAELNTSEGDLANVDLSALLGGNTTWTE